jgi:DNA-binding MarR family transcriptional regulator
MATATSTTTAPALASRLRLSATRLARTLRRQADTGLSPSQLSALATIETHGSMTLGALAVHERVAPPSITKVISKLENARLVTRAPDPDDRRIARVALSIDGEILLRESRKRKDAWLAERLAQLDAGDRARLAAALDVLDSLVSS